MKKDIACIILAAGRGVRMKSNLPKVLHLLCGRPMLNYVIDLAKGLKIKNTVLVLGHKHEKVRKVIPGGINVVVQKKLLGTADAVKVALSKINNFRGTVLILYGDIPLLEKATINKLLEYHIENNMDATLLTANLDKPWGYGRILRDRYASVCGIIEEKDADDFQKEIKEVNTGIICFNKDRLTEALRQIRPSNRKKEYYLTDAIDILYRKGYVVDGIRIENMDEALGINSRQDLALANKIMQQRINTEFMKEGITILDPATTFINYGTKIGQDTIIYPFTVIERGVRIGRRCSVGPFIHLREDTHIEDDVVAGNFLEIVRSKISSGTWIKHLGYLGDSRIGKRVNIGAGTVIANFDGKKKNNTVIKDNAFIGSDTVLVAPVKIGKAAKTGAGAVVPRNRNVPDGATVVGVPARLLKKHR